MADMTDFDTITAPVEERIVTALARIATAMRGKAWVAADKSGLTPTQADILTLLASRSQGVRLATVAEQLAMTPATASDAVRVLEAKGWVEKGRAADDGRALALRLTAQGSEQAGAVAGWGQFLAVAVQGLNEAEKAALLRALIKVIGTLQAQGEIAPARMCVSCRYFEANRYQDQARPHHCHLVGAPFGDQHLRLDCPEHEASESKQQWMVWAKVETD